jgi:hypothetical protein
MIQGLGLSALAYCESFTGSVGVRIVGFTV